MKRLFRSGRYLRLIWVRRIIFLLSPPHLSNCEIQKGSVAALEGVLGNRLRAFERINASIPALKNVLSWGCPLFLT